MADFEENHAVTESVIGGSSRKCEWETGVSVPQGTAYHGEETSPDMLNNTPSNIRRLADEIQHCEARQKYLVQTRSPSDGGDVPWFFCKVPLADNELAASVPRTEIVGKGDYFRFGMRDFLAIEASFLQREEELLSSWWKEYAECSEGPKSWPRSSAKLNPQSKASSLESAQSAQLHALEEDRVGVPVKGGLYEIWHQRTFQPSGLFAARVDLQGSIPGLHALFTGEDDTWEAWLDVNASAFSSVISLRGNGIMLRRGYAASQSPKPTQQVLLNGT